MQKLAFMAIRDDNGNLNPLSQKEVKILQVAANVEFRYLPELKEFFYELCNENFDTFKYQLDKLIDVPLKFFSPPLRTKFIHENGFKLRLFLQIFKDGNDVLLERIIRMADWQ
jgi:hypothetical protein